MSVKEIITQIEIPSYSKKEETFNSISHLLGFPVAVFVLMFSINLFINNKISLFYFIGLLIFAFSMAAVYLISAIYHYLDLDSYIKKFFRVLDHCTIYLLIAGTYTPICVVLMSEHVIGLIMLIIEWSLAALGIFLNAMFFRSKVVQVISLILYLAMGWLVLFCGGFIYMSAFSFGFVLAGGIIYSIGSILYSVGKKNLWFHCIFHVFVLVSTVIQAIGVMSLFF